MFKHSHPTESSQQTGKGRMSDTTQERGKKLSEFQLAKTEVWVTAGSNTPTLTLIF